MRLLQLNAWTIRLETRVLDMIEKERPDIMTLQEVLESESDLSYFPTLSQLVARAQFNNTYFSPAYSLAFAGRDTEFGNATISKSPFLETDTLFTHLGYTKNMQFDKDDYNIRNFQHVIVTDQASRKVHILNHHGFHIPEHKKGSNITLKAIQQIIDYTKSLAGPIIIAGDFNLEPTSRSIEHLSSQFCNLAVLYKLKTTRTDLTSKSEVCDYIFINDQIEVNDFYMSDIIASDHRGLVLDFKIKEF